MPAYLLILAVAGLLVFAIVDDMRNYRVRNDVVLLLLCLYILRVLVVGDYRQALIHGIVAGLLFALILVFYARGWMGGGDAKLFGVAFLWLENAELTTFSILLTLLTIAYVVTAKLKLLPSRGQAKMVIPFAPCIAGAWLLTISPALLG
jgi:prepilin peptidase CpaA